MSPGATAAITGSSGSSLGAGEDPGVCVMPRVGTTRTPPRGLTIQAPYRSGALVYTRRVIFKRVGDGRPYPEHGFSSRAWAAVPPRQVRLDDLVTTKKTLQLDDLLVEDSTFYGDLFAHVVEWRGEFYLEDGLHRALRAALHQRNVLHARVLTVDS